MNDRPQMPDVLLREELDGVVIGIKQLKRDLLKLSAALQAQGIAIATTPLRSAYDYICDTQQIIDILVPKIGAELARQLEETLPGHPAKEESGT